MERNEEITRSYYRAVDAKDLDTLISYFHPNCVYHRGGYAPIVGQAALKDFYQHTRVIADGAHSVGSVVADGPLVAVRGEFTGVSRDGEDLRIGWSDFFVFQDDLIKERTTYFLTAGV